MIRRGLTHHTRHTCPRPSVSNAMSVGQFVSAELVSSVLDRKDNTWLQLDVCPVWRERGSCPSLELCCHAHPPPHIEILERCSMSTPRIQCFQLSI